MIPSDFSSRTILGKLIRVPLRFLPPDAQVRILRGRLRGKRWIAGSSVNSCWLGHFEDEKRRLFEQTVTAGSVVFDIGAHVGYYTLLSSQLVGPSGKVYAFEPVLRNLFYIKTHLRINRIRNVTVIEAAVSDREGTASFDLASDNSVGHIGESGNLQVRTVGLDQLRSRNEIPEPDYIKIDVEGAEMLVLSGAKSILSTTYPTLFLSTHGSDLHYQCSRFLESLGYQVRTVGEPAKGRHYDLLGEIIAYRPGRNL